MTEEHGGLVYKKVKRGLPANKIRPDYSRANGYCRVGILYERGLSIDIFGEVDKESGRIPRAVKIQYIKRVEEK